MKTYFAFLKVHFVNLIQYRIAAYAGVIAQFCWAIMSILLYKAFYQSNSVSSTMTINEVVSYIWLQQAFFTLFITWYLDNGIISAISEGQIAYELCRPTDLYNMWFFKNMASRLAQALLRFIPILLVASVLPKPFRLSMAKSGSQFILFLISMILAFLLVVAFCMIIYITTFHTVSPMGVRMVMASLVDFLAGGVIPLPFFPESIRKIIDLLPFASMQNAPFRIFSGNISGMGAVNSILLQIFWIIVLVAGGKMWLRKSLRRVVVQGG